MGWIGRVPFPEDEMEKEVWKAVMQGMASHALEASKGTIAMNDVNHMALSVVNSLIDNEECRVALRVLMSRKEQQEYGNATDE